ncbi:hypothetical protein D3C78_1809690 [compost metagenome]
MGNMKLNIRPQQVDNQGENGRLIDQCCDFRASLYTIINIVGKPLLLLSQHFIYSGIQSLHSVRRQNPRQDQVALLLEFSFEG